MSLERNNIISGGDENTRDNLRKISRVGQAYADALYQIGIRRFTDLTGYTPKTLSQALLEQAGVRVKAEKIESEDWIGQARRLDQQAQIARSLAEAQVYAAKQPDEIIVRRGDTMDEITLQRGGRPVTFKKLTDSFAVRLKQGRAANEARLESSLGYPETKVRHVDAIAPAKIDVFAVDDPAKLEETVDKLREAPGADVVSHVYALDDTPGSEVIPTGTLTIQFKPDVPKAQREAILAEFGLGVVEDIHYLPNGYTVRLTSASTENPLKIAGKLQQRPEIEIAEPDLSFKIALQYTPTDTLYSQQWHLHNRGDQVGLLAGADVKAEMAWEYTRGSRAVTICVIDDGFDLGHPEFNAPDKIVSPRDFGQNDFIPDPVFDDDRHGTACAGVAVAEENGQGVVGLASGCAFMPVRFTGGTDDNSIVSYFQHAIDQGADVISCSWSARNWYFPLSTKISGIISYAATQGRHNQKGCVILFAAGNDSRPLDGVKDGQLSAQGFALHPNVIAVAASNSLDQHSHYSNYGPELALCAPSSGAGGRDIVTTDRRGIAGYDTKDDYTTGFGGTSSATPLAAGLAALILSVNPDLTAAAVKLIMMETADPIDPENGQYVNGHSPLYGHGRINAQRAVERAIALKRDASGGAEKSVAVTLTIPVVELSTAPGQELRAEVQFQLSGSDAETLAATQTPFRVEIRTIDAGNGATNLVAAQQDQLQPNVLAYLRQLDFPLPPLGHYESEACVTLVLPSGEIQAHQQGRSLRII